MENELFLLTYSIQVQHTAQSISLTTRNVSFTAIWTLQSIFSEGQYPTHMLICLHTRSEMLL